MLEFNHIVPNFSQFATDEAPIFELLITERGETIPREEWVDGGLRVNVDNVAHPGEKDILTKYVDRTDKPGFLQKLAVKMPDGKTKRVVVDKTRHAGHQLYRWGHRTDQVEWDEVLSDINIALPTMIKFAENGMEIGDAYDRGNLASAGKVWIQNADSNLNLVVQLKNAPEREIGYKYRLAIVTIIRIESSKFIKAYMPKLVISGDTVTVEREPAQY